MEEWVFVDTCIWASFFGKPDSPEKATEEARRLVDPGVLAFWKSFAAPRGTR
jgi:hypothetical protein